MVQERHESTIEVNFDTARGEAALNRLQRRLDRILSSAQNASRSLFGSGFGTGGGGGGGFSGVGGIGFPALAATGAAVGAAGLMGRAGAGAAGGGRITIPATGFAGPGAMYGPRAPAMTTGVIGSPGGMGLNTPPMAVDAATGLHLPAHLANQTGYGRPSATPTPTPTPTGPPVVPVGGVNKGLIRSGVAMGAMSLVSQTVQQEAAGYRAEHSGRVSRNLRKAQADRRMVTNTLPTAALATAGFMFGGPAGALVMGGLGMMGSSMYDAFASSREDTEMAAVEARSERAHQLADIHRQEGLARFTGGLESGPAARSAAARRGFNVTQGVQLQNQFARAAGTRVRGTNLGNLFNAAAMGADVGDLGRFEGMGGRGIITNPVGGSAFRLLREAQRQGLTGSAASGFVSDIGSVAENMRSQFGIRMSGPSIEQDVSAFVQGGLQTRGLTNAFGGFRRVGAGVAQDMFGGLAQGIAGDAAFLQAAGRSSSMGDLFKNLRNLSARDLNRGIGQIAGNTELADITRAITGNISMDEARGLRGGFLRGMPGIAPALAEPDAQLPAGLRASLDPAIRIAKADVEMKERITAQDITNLIDAAHRAALAMDKLADKVDTLQL